MACEFCCCLLPQCEALCICRSGFPIAILLYTVLPPTAYNLSRGDSETCYYRLLPGNSRHDYPSPLRYLLLKHSLFRQRNDGLVNVKYAVFLYLHFWVCFILLFFCADAT